MDFEKNQIYLVSKQSFTYNDEGYVPNKEGVIPLKAFMTQSQAEKFADNLLRDSIIKDIDNIIEPLMDESMEQKYYLKLMEFLGTEVETLFEPRKNGTYTYYKINDSTLNFTKLKHLTLNAVKTLGFEQNQILCSVLVGANLIQIDNIELDL